MNENSSIAEILFVLFICACIGVCVGGGTGSVGLGFAAALFSTLIKIQLS